MRKHTIAAIALTGALCLAPWAEAAKEKNLDWQVEIQEDLPDIIADPMRLA